MAVTAQSVPILKDNYAWLLRDSETGATAIVDPAEGPPIIAAIEAAGGRLDMILLTHHRVRLAPTPMWSVPGFLVARWSARQPMLTGCRNWTRAVQEGDTVKQTASTARVIDTPGHTVGQINYFFPGGPILLSGDTLFSLGCGRLIEGDATQMFASLGKLAALPDDTLVCCGHEYTEANAKFALSVDPNNKALQARTAEAHQHRAAGQPTIPSRWATKKMTVLAGKGRRCSRRCAGEEGSVLSATRSLRETTMRTGSDYRTSLRDGRRVWVMNDGLVADVTTHPATGAMVEEYATWYDRHFRYCPPGARD